MLIFAPDCGRERERGGNSLENTLESNLYHVMLLGYKGRVGCLRLCEARETVSFQEKFEKVLR